MRQSDLHTWLKLKSLGFRGSYFVFSLALSLLILGCGEGSLFNQKLFKERALETPVPSEHNISKSFFRHEDGRSKTFLCGWAPERSRSAWGTWTTQLRHHTMHCNIEFEITEKALVGRMIHPSYPEDRTRWIKAVEIPIVKHFYYERNRDQYGRETNEYIENDRRSHWSARPEMRLDLAGMSTQGFFGTWSTRNSRTISIQDVEWDFESNFLAFTLNTQLTSNWSRIAETLEMSLRVNFLEYETDYSFDKLPYHQKNARFMNILHTFGRRIDGVAAELYAGRWDLRKPQTIYISGIPDDKKSYIGPILIEAVEHWNRSFEKIGAIQPGQKAFIPVIQDLKNPFDLRYTAIHWIDDREVSMNSPLGIGLAHADVRNGKILWGNVILYGGMLDNYVNRYAVLDGSGAPHQRILPVGSDQSFLGGLAAPPSFQDLNRQSQGDWEQALRQGIEGSIERELFELSFEPGTEDDVAVLDRQLQFFAQQNHPYIWNDIVNQAIHESERTRRQTEEFFSQHSVLDLIGGYQVSHANFEVAEIFSDYDQESVQTLLSQGDADGLRNFSPTPSALVIEHERTFEDVFLPWMSQYNQLFPNGERSFDEILASVIMDLTLHEIGHMLGLGHQFMENILPERGTVPSRYLDGNPRAETQVARDGLVKRASEEYQFSNYTSVMGYRHGKTSMWIPVEDLEPGPQDHLVLRYLYTGKYPVYDPDQDDFEFVRVPEGGLIPLETPITKNGQFKRLQTSYFPNCNDYEATLGYSPFCNRWARGHTAEQIVRSHFEDLSDNLLSVSFSPVGDTGPSRWRAEWFLWLRAKRTFTRAQLFYAEMRRRLRTEERLIPLWNRLRQDNQALFEFSSACQQEDPTDINSVASPVLRELFAHKDMVDLCRANALVLKESKFLLGLPEADYTRVDHSQSYVSGGFLTGDARRGTSQMFGQWYRLTNFPLKFVALNNLTDPNARLSFGWWTPRNPYYNTPDDRTLYRTLYPREYTQIVADTVRLNMQFASDGGHNARTSMGWPVLMSSWLLRQQAWANDSTVVRPSYLSSLTQQTDFRFSMVAVIIEADEPDPSLGVKNNHYKRFSASIYDFFTGQTRAARDVYILPKGEVFVRANDMFIYPRTKMRFINDKKFFVVAYKVDYDYEVNDPLLADSVKVKLMELYEEVGTHCIEGGGHGLASFFEPANRDFDGFYLPEGISRDRGTEKITRFQNSIDEAFYTYRSQLEQKNLRNMEVVCEEALRGMGQILSAAALVQGWWLPMTRDLVVR